jgi:catalase-peroxidase
MSAETKCPVTGSASKRTTMASGGQGNREWWPNQLNLAVLH